MSSDACILTAKALTTLEEMLERDLVHDDRLAPILKRKVGSALVMFPEDVPGNVATLGSRIEFKVGDGPNETRVLSEDRMTSTMGTLLPIATLRGLALLGLSEGQEFSFLNVDGLEERVRLERVRCQPEAARREMTAEGAMPAGKSMLNAIRGVFRSHPPLEPPTGDQIGTNAKEAGWRPDCPGRKR